ncbi:hypothetical protein FOXB_16241, partial [Fusarium oxysporum f. sp. conglutinans Fo5176]
REIPVRPANPLSTLYYYKLGNPESRFCYADDAAILSIGDTVGETSTMARSIHEMTKTRANKQTKSRIPEL